MGLLLVGPNIEPLVQERSQRTDLPGRVSGQLLVLDELHVRMAVARFKDGQR